MANIAKFFGTLLGSANPAAPAADIVDGAQKIIGMFKLDPTVKAQLDAQLTTANVDLEKAQLAAVVSELQGQLQVNEAEANTKSLFIAGWRPAVGWVCAASLAYTYAVQPLLTFILATFHHSIVLPPIDFSFMSTILIGMLGIAGARTVEKVMGVPDTNKKD